MPVPPAPIPLAVARAAGVLPSGAMAFEPKLDGWRCCAHVPDGVLHTRRSTDITSRFPEVLDAARTLGQVVLDGELVAYQDGRLVFEPLMWGRRRREAEGVSLALVVFDLIAARGRDLRNLPYQERRARLARLLQGRTGGVQLMDSSTERARGAAWIAERYADVGIEGTVAKPLASRYPTRGGPAGWVKVKFRQEVDAVVLGVTGSLNSPTSLVLADIDDAGDVRAVGLSTTLPAGIRSALAGRLRPAGVLRHAAGIVAGLGVPDLDYQPVAPGIVVEVRTDGSAEWGAFRHRLTPVRVKPDL